MFFIGAGVVVGAGLGVGVGVTGGVGCIQPAAMIIPSTMSMKTNIGLFIFDSSFIPVKGQMLNSLSVYLKLLGLAPNSY
jgi:TctA family transporter